MRNFILFVTLLLSVFATSCKDMISDMSDENGVENFVLKVYNDNIQLGGVEMDQVNHVITIPVIYGKYNFPLSMVIDFKPVGKVDRIFDIDFSKPVVFESITDEKTFVVVAESGKSAKWTIKLKELPRSEDNDIEKFMVSAITPTDVLYCAEGLINQNDTTVTIMTLLGVFPLSFKAEATISDTASFKKFVNGNRLEFNSLDVHNPLTVTASSGKDKTWKIKIAQPEMISDINLVTDEVKERVSLSGLDVSDFDAEFLAANEILDSYIDNRTGEINIDYRPKVVVAEPAMAKGKSSRRVSKAIEDVHQSTSLSVNFDYNENAQIMGLDPTQKIGFNETIKEHVFYVLDNISRKARTWKIKLNCMLSDKGNVTAFEYKSRTATQSWKLKVKTPGNKSFIDVENKTVYVYVEVPWILGLTKAWGDFWVTPTLITVSDRAAISGIETKEYNFSSSTYKDGFFKTQPFTITSEDGTVHQWKMAFKDIASLVSGNDITSLAVTSYLPRETTVDPEAIINNENKTVTITVREDLSQFKPVTINTSINVSEYATVHGGAYPTLKFETPSTEHPLTVTSENGTAQEWIVKLNIVEPPKEAGANVIEYTISNVSKGNLFDLSKTVIDQEKQEIVLSMKFSDPKADKLSYKHMLSISKGAKLEGITNGGILEWTSLSEIKQFKVIAQNGESKNWKIRIEYKPQLENFTFEKFSGSGKTTVVTGWANANNSFADAATVVKKSGMDGSNCVELTSVRPPAMVAIAAGSLFLGEFKFEMAPEKPKKMTWFGIPFTARPTSVTFEYSYTVPGGSGDQGSATINMLNYEGDAFEFHDLNGETYVTESPGITKIARKQKLLNPTTGWEKITLPLEYTSTLRATHISIAFSSSAQGDKFIGVVGAQLKIDNITLNYE